MNSNIVSGILAQALVSLPRITSEDLFNQCAGQIGDTSLAQFKVELAKWLTEKDNPNYIPGYESRKGRVGGIYKIGAKNEALISTAEPKVKLDPTPIQEILNKVLETEPRITVSDLYEMNGLGLTLQQFRAQMSEWLNDGVTFPAFEARKGPTGGVYLKGSESIKWIPESSDDETEHSNGLSVQITDTIKLVSGERNWKIQKLTGETWVNKGYHSDLAGCLNSLIRHTVNGEYALLDQLVQLKDLYSVVKEVEGRVLNHLEKHTAVIASA